MTNEQYQELKRIASWNEIKRNTHQELINLYQVLIRPRYICPRCPDALWGALEEIKALYLRVEAPISTPDTQAAVEAYKTPENEGNGPKTTKEPASTTQPKDDAKKKGDKK